jgi:ubiquinone/menaquinone biosynthesis C-methylase UbiE
VHLGPRVLEIGPGFGVTTDILCESVEQLTCIEVDPHLAQKLERRMSGRNVKIICGDAASMSFADGTFDGVVCFTMLHHVPSPELQNRLLGEVCRVIKPGGVFSGSDSLQGLFMRVIHLGDTLVPVNPDTFGERLEAAGFELLEIEKGSQAFRFQARRPVFQTDRAVHLLEEKT